MFRIAVSLIPVKAMQLFCVHFGSNTITFVATNSYQRGYELINFLLFLQDKEYKSKLLREEIQRNAELQAEIRQLNNQVESLNHMLEVMADSKEMVANEMRAQQTANMEVSFSSISQQ